MKKQKPKTVNLDDMPDRKLVGANIVEHLKHEFNVTSATFNYFHFKSKLVRAIQDHVMHGAKECLLIDKEGRDSSYAVSVKEASAPFAAPGECQMLRLTFEVGFRPLPDDAEYNGCDGGVDINKRMDVYCPADLELNFTKEKFNLWLNTTIREKNHRERDAKNLKALEELLLKYPKQGRDLLKKMKRSA